MRAWSGFIQSAATSSQVKSWSIIPLLQCVSSKNSTHLWPLQILHTEQTPCKCTVPTWERPGSEVFIEVKQDMWVFSHVVCVIPCQRKLVSRTPSSLRGESRAERGIPDPGREEGRELQQVLHSNPRPLLSCPLVCLYRQTVATSSGGGGVVKLYHSNKA